jgi:hypothetical protein
MLLLPTMLNLPNHLLRKSMRASILAGTLSLFALAAPGMVQAQAQAPSDGADLVRLMHDRYVGKWYKTLTFTQATQRRTAADTMVHETWYEAMKLPGRLRIDVGATNGDPILLFAHDSTFTRRGGKTLPGRAGRNPLLLLGFDVYTQPTERTVAALREDGFDLSKIHQGTWQGRPALIVGAAAGDTTSKQFWVDTERLVFVRMIGPLAPGRPGLEEVRFDKYEPLGGGWLSTYVTATRDGKLIQSEAYSDIRVNVPVSDDRLDPTKLDKP